MSRVYLVFGGTRSGKSLFAEQLSTRLGPRVGYVATALLVGIEAHERSARHRARRPASWTFLREPYELTACAAHGRDADVLLLEDLYTWTANHLFKLGDPEDAAWREGLPGLEAKLIEATQGLIADARANNYHLVLVNSEVGLGITPETRRQRAFRDLIGRVTETAAAAADEAFFVVAGHALPIRRMAVKPEDVVP